MIPEDKETCLERFWWFRWKQCDSLSDLQVNLNDAGLALQNSLFYTAGSALIAAGLEVSTLVSHIFYGGYQYEPSHWADYRWLELDMEIPANGITMEALLAVMLAAEADEVMYFVGLVDAYRQSVWTKPFNEDFYAALARGFEKWP